MIERMRRTFYNGCAAFVEHCDYMPDERWRVVGPYVHWLYRTCDRLAASYYTPISVREVKHR